jgi:hypothetical protein
LAARTGTRSRRRGCLADDRHAAQWPEAVRTEARIRVPEIIAGEIDVLPAERGEVGEERFGHHLAAVAQRVERAVQVHAVPERDSGSDEGQPAGAVLLRLDGAIAQAAEPVEADGAGERVAGLSLIQLRRERPGSPPLLIMLRRRSWRRRWARVSTLRAALAKCATETAAG